MINPFKLKEENAKLVETNKTLTAELEALKSQDQAKEIASLNTKIEELTGEVAAKTKTAEDLTASNKALTDEVATLKAKLAETEKHMADFDKATTAKAVDMVAAQAVPAVPSVPEGKTKEEIVAEFNSIKNPVEARAFYVKNYAVLNEK